ncbi:MAG: hypothetical protein V5B38_14300 [Candidatus Accumulibacter propinquus]|jgi:hypothetical protein
MSAAIEASMIEHLHRLDDQRQAKVLDFVEYLASKSGAASPTVAWPQIEPSRDLAKFVGVATGFPEDGVAYHRQIRDTEWPTYESQNIASLPS